MGKEKDRERKKENGKWRDSVVVSLCVCVDSGSENWKKIHKKTEMLKRVEELKSNIAKMQKQVDEIQAEAEKI